MDPSMLRPMLSQYFNEKIKELENASSKNDYNEIKEIAHKVKGNSGTIALGYNSLNDIGTEIEKAALDEADIGDIKVIIAKLKQESNKCLS